MTLTAMPQQIIAGDSLALSIEPGEYTAADGWAAALTLTPIMGGTPVVTAATGGAASWEIAVTSTVSAALAAGAYRYLVAATKAGQRSTIRHGEVQVLPNPAANVDQRSAAQRALAAIDAVLEGRAGSADIEFTFEDGRSIKKMPHSELIALRKFYARRVAAEKLGRRGPARINMRL
jgi:hypothetical protein